MDSQALIIQKRQFSAIIIAGIAIAVLFHGVVDTLVLTKSMMPVFRVVLGELITWTTLPVLYLYAVKVEDRDFFIWPEKSRSVWFYIISIAALFVMAYGDRLIASIPRQLGFQDDYKVMRYYSILFKSNRPLLVFVCLTAGFTEEVLMRGYVLPRLCLLFKSSYLPVIISALIFSLLHLGYGNLSEIIFTFVFGIICAVYYNKYQNIQVLIIFHFLYDYMVFSR